VVVGRICCDEDAKLNEASLVLETSRLMGAGARTPLKINPDVTINGDMSVYPLFPGAIVALKGRNETGEWFQVSGILTVRKPCIYFYRIERVHLDTATVTEHRFQCPRKTIVNDSCFWALYYGLRSLIFPFSVAPGSSTGFPFCMAPISECATVPTLTA